MGGAKKFMDLCFDFLVFLTGIAFVMAGFVCIERLQREQKKHVASGMQSMVYVSVPYDEYLTGAEIILYLLREDACKVTYEGEVYEPSMRRGLREKLSLTDMYTVRREYEDENVNAPVMLEVIKMPGEDEI